jgi:hypothetical protein
MPTPRINPDRVLTPAENQARVRQRVAAYIEMLEQAVRDADTSNWTPARQRHWKQAHVVTIHRARQSVDND